MRLAVSRRSDLAIRLLGALPHADSVKTGSDLAELVGSSSGFVAQVLSPMVRQRWVHSEKGPNGGYSLSVKLGDISVREVIETIEGPTETGRCVLEDSWCETSEYCALHESWSHARTVLLEHLSTVSVADAVSHKSAGDSE